MMEAHALGMAVLGVTTFIAGSIPLKLSRRYQDKLFISLLLCFGGGVLLATSIVHMFEEVHGKMAFGGIIFCGGFLLLYAVDEVIHLCIGDPYTLANQINKSSSCCSRRSSESSDGLIKYRRESLTRKTSYGTINKLPKRLRVDSVSKGFQEENEQFEDDLADNGSLGNAAPSHGDHCCRPHFRSNSFYAIETETPVEKRESTLPTTNSSSTGDLNSNLCHVELKSGPCRKSNLSLPGLLVALMIHAILEGISIGVQTTSAQIAFVLTAVSCHKLVLSFCLGLELSSAGVIGIKFLLFIGAFSIGCPIGIIVGISLTRSANIVSVEAPLQAIAAGSLLYVAVFEVLPRERFKWQHMENQRFAGILQMLAVLTGFAVINLIEQFLHH